MKQVISASIAALEGLTVALVSAITLAVLVAVFWFSEFGFAPDAKPLGAVIGALWLLGHGVSLGIPLSPETVVALHFEPEQIIINLSLPVTGVLVLTVARAIIGGWRMTGDIASRFLHVVFAIIGFGSVAALMVTLAHPVVSVPLWWAILFPVLIVVVCYLIGAFARGLLREGLWESHVSPWLVSRTRAAWLSDVLFAAGALASRVCLGIVALAGVGGLFGIIAHFAAQLRIMQELQLDLPGVFAVGVGAIFYLPTVLIWVVSWLSGAGFSVGAGSSFSPFDRLTPPLPEFPMLAMLPQSLGGAAVVAPLLLVAVVAFIAALSGKRSPWGGAPWWQMVCGAFFVGVFVGLVALIVLLFSIGAVGPGRLSEAGPTNTWLVAGLLAGYSFVGVLIGAGSRRLDGLWLDPLSSFVEQEHETRRVRREERWIGLGESYDTSAQTAVVDAEELTEQYAWDSKETQAEVFDFATGKIADNPVPVPVADPADEQVTGVVFDTAKHVMPVHEPALFDNELPDPVSADEVAVEEAMRAFEWQGQTNLETAEKVLREATGLRSGDSAIVAEPEKKRDMWRFWKR